MNKKTVDLSKKNDSWIYSALIKSHKSQIKSAFSSRAGLEEREHQIDGSYLYTLFYRAHLT